MPTRLPGAPELGWSLPEATWQPPWRRISLGDLRVNISGALVLGFLFTLLTERLTIALWLRSALLIGFLGAYTTFSMAWQTAL